MSNFFLHLNSARELQRYKIVSKILSLQSQLMSKCCFQPLHIAHESLQVLFTSPLQDHRIWEQCPHVAIVISYHRLCQQHRNLGIHLLHRQHWLTFLLHGGQLANVSSAGDAFIIAKFSLFFGENFTSMLK